MEKGSDTYERWNLAAEFMGKLVDDQEFRAVFAGADRFTRFQLMAEEGISQEDIIKLDNDLAGLSKVCLNFLLWVFLL